MCELWCSKLTRHFYAIHGIHLHANQARMLWESNDRPEVFGGLRSVNCFGCMPWFMELMKQSILPIDALRVCRCLDQYFKENRLLDLLLSRAVRFEVKQGNLPAFVKDTYSVSTSHALELIYTVYAFWHGPKPILYAPPSTLNAEGEQEQWRECLQRNFFERWSVSLGAELCTIIWQESFKPSLRDKKSVMEDVHVRTLSTAQMVHRVLGPLEVERRVVRTIDEYMNDTRIEDALIKRKIKTGSLEQFVSWTYELPFDDAVCVVLSAIAFRSSDLDAWRVHVEPQESPSRPASYIPFSTASSV